MVRLYGGDGREILPERLRMLSLIYIGQNESLRRVFGASLVMLKYWAIARLDGTKGDERK